MDDTMSIGSRKNNAHNLLSFAISGKILGKIKTILEREHFCRGDLEVNYITQVAWHAMAVIDSTSCLLGLIL